VALSGDGETVVVGAPSNFSGDNGLGRARVLRYDAGTDTWLQLGAVFVGENENDFLVHQKFVARRPPLTYIGQKQGESVAISDDGNTVAMGAHGNDDAGDNAGHVRVYAFSGSEWLKLGATLEGEAAKDRAVRCQCCVCVM
jgi:hypothetical protein